MFVSTDIPVLYVFLCIRIKTRRVSSPQPAVSLVHISTHQQSNTHHQIIAFSHCQTLYPVKTTCTWPTLSCLGFFDVIKEKKTSTITNGSGNTAPQRLTPVSRFYPDSLCREKCCSLARNIQRVAKIRTDIWMMINLLTQLLNNASAVSFNAGVIQHEAGKRRQRLIRPSASLTLL